MEVLEQIKAKVAEINKQKEELVSQLRKDFAPMLQPLFEKSSGKIQSISWSQYTPYFNDGDECVFSVHADLDYSLKLNGVSFDDYDEDEEDQLFGSKEYGMRKYLEGEDVYQDWIKRYPDDTLNPDTKDEDLRLYKIAQEFESVLNSIDDEFFKDLFGDHVEVTVYADGRVETERYEHD